MSHPPDNVIQFPVKAPKKTSSPFGGPVKTAKSVMPLFGFVLALAWGIGNSKIFSVPRHLISSELGVYGLLESEGGNGSGRFLASVGGDVEVRDLRNVEYEHKLAERLAAGESLEMASLGSSLSPKEKFETDSPFSGKYDFSWKNGKLRSISINEAMVPHVEGTSFKQLESALNRHIGHLPGKRVLDTGSRTQIEGGRVQATFQLTGLDMQSDSTVTVELDSENRLWSINIR